MSNIDFTKLITSEEKEADRQKALREGIKGEAYRRIISVCPEWKQRNLTAQATLLIEKGKDNWTEEEVKAWNAGKAIWDSIAFIRACSDKLESMNPIPEDFTDDKYWTNV